jgi:DNA-binding SARP family transcriptional activator
VLLASLLIELGQVVSAAQLAARIWDDEPPPDARGALYAHMSRLRTNLADQDGGELVATRSLGYQIDLPEDAVDVFRFRRLARDARTAWSAGDAAGTAKTLTEALELCRGHPLSDVPSDFLHRTAARAIAEEVLDARQLRIDADLRLGRHNEVLAELGGMTSRHPLRERFWEQRMLALYRAGRQAEALDCYRAAGDLLADQLGVDPGHAMRDLHTMILREAPELDNRPPEPVAVVHTLQPVPRQLPPDITDFTARATESERLRTWLTDTADRGDATRIAALTGQGGIGKTTLAVHTARSLAAEFPDGQLFVDLRGAESKPAAPVDVLGGFLRAFGITGQALPDGLDDRIALYRSLVADRRVLVVLDNAADEAQVLPLLPAGDGCAVVITSRARLAGLSGADHVEVATFSTADSVRFLGDAIGLDRVNAELRSARDLAGQCGGLPLALRIAAARLIGKPHWRLDDLATRLSAARRPLNEFVHGGLDVRSSLALSYEGIAPASRRMFRAVSLLDAPDFPAWAGAALLDIEPAEAEDLLEELVDARLLLVDEHDRADRFRYRFHDLVRVYARELAAAEDPPAARAAALERALGGWLALAQQAHCVVYGGDFTVLHGNATRWLPPGLVDRVGIPDRPIDWLDGERFALRAAIYRGAELGLHELCWDLTWTAVTLYEARGYFDEWRQTARHVLAATQAAGNRRGTAAMLQTLASAYGGQMANDKAEKLSRQALEIFTEIGGEFGTAITRHYAGIMAGRSGRVETALAELDAALVIFRRFDDQYFVAGTIRAMAWLHLGQGNLLAAEEYIEQSVAIFRQIGGRCEAQGTHMLGEVRLKQGRFTDAEVLFRRSMDVLRSIGDRFGETYPLLGLAEALTGQGKLAAAEVPVHQALTLARQFGLGMMESRALALISKLAVTTEGPIKIGNT